MDYFFHSLIEISFLETFNLNIWWELMLAWMGEHFIKGYADVESFYNSCLSVSLYELAISCFSKWFIFSNLLWNDVYIYILLYRVVYSWTVVVFILFRIIKSVSVSTKSTEKPDYFFVVSITIIGTWGLSEVLFKERTWK